VGEAAHVPVVHGAGAPRGRAHPGRAGRAGAGPHEVRAGPRAGLWTAAQRARHVAGAGGIHGGRGHRPRSLRLLPLARHQFEAALRLDGNVGHGVRAAQRRGEARHGGPAHERRPRARQRMPRAGSTPATRATSTPAAT
jgi:hypothetical protein